MENNAETPPETTTAHIALSGPDWQFQTKVTVPAGPTQVDDMLPLAQALANALVSSAVNTIEKQGQRISCTKGCGACCRQLVPIAPVEARRINAVINALPEPRQDEIRTRFATAYQQLAQTELLTELQAPTHWTEGQGRVVGMKYFQQNIPCPFLEEGACSIYADRPIACREYLVMSPAENCAQPTPETIQTVKLPLRVWLGLARYEQGTVPEPFVNWVPLILAPEWAEAHPEQPSPQPGPTLVKQFFDHLTNTALTSSRPSTPLSENPTPASSSQE